MECHSKCWGSGCLWQGSVGLCSFRGCTTEANSRWAIQNGSPAKLRLLPLFCSESLVVEALEWEGFRLVATPASQLACLVLWLTGPALQLAIAGAWEVKSVDAHAAPWNWLLFVLSLKSAELQQSRTLPSLQWSWLVWEVWTLCSSQGETWLPVGIAWT